MSGRPIPDRPEPYDVFAAPDLDAAALEAALMQANADIIGEATLAETTRNRIRAYLAALPSAAEREGEATVPKAAVEAACAASVAVYNKGFGDHSTWPAKHDIKGNNYKRRVFRTALTAALPHLSIATEARALAAEKARDEARAGTPAAQWRADGKPDPHGSQYDCERSSLCLGGLTDDQIANEVFLRPDVTTTTAAKERIRWLSRKLTEALRERDEARALVTEANNSLYGSQGYFHSLNGGPFDKYHLARGIENLKEDCGKRYVALQAAESALATARAELEAAREAEQEACAKAAYPGPDYVCAGPNGFLEDERGDLMPGSPYDRGRYDAACAIRARAGAQGGDRG